MKWVKNNIEFFGGDSELITVFGESAGGTSTCYLSISKLTENLFERAIIESGPCLGLWGIEIFSNELNYLTTLKLFDHFNITKNDYS